MSYSIAPHPRLLRHCFSLSLERDWQPTSHSHSPVSAPRPMTLALELQVYTATLSFSYGCRGFELRSPGLHSKYSYPLSPLPSMSF